MDATDDDASVAPPSSHLCNEAVRLSKRSGDVQRADVRRPRVKEQVRIQHTQAVLPAGGGWIAGGVSCRRHLLCAVCTATRAARLCLAGLHRPQQHKLCDGADTLQCIHQLRRGPQQRQQRSVHAVLQDSKHQLYGPLFPEGSIDKSTRLLHVSITYMP